MADESPVFSYARTGFKLDVYPNRVEVEEKAGLLRHKRHTIPIRSISNVSVEGITRKLRITTNDGKTQDFNLANKAEEARQAILTHL